MKKLLAELFLLASPVFAGTYTSRSGLYKPAVGERPYGEQVNANFDIIDSSFGVLSATQTWTGTNTFPLPVAFSSATFYRVWINTPTYTNTSDRLAIKGDT